MKRPSNITSLAMMLVVLLLGIFIPSLPDLDDGDDNVGCAAVMPLAPRKADADASSNEQRLKRSGRSASITNNQETSRPAAISAIAPATISLSQVATPLRS